MRTFTLDTGIPIVLLMILVAPIYIAPLFDTFTPLIEKQPDLVPELEKVLARGGKYAQSWLTQMEGNAL